MCDLFLSPFMPIRMKMSFLVPAKAFLQPSPTQRIRFRVHLRVLEVENDYKKAVGGNGLITAACALGV